MFDREGRPVSVEEFSRLKRDPDYVRIGGTTVGRWWVSTVWLGVNHRLDGTLPPLLFETMIFPSNPSVPADWDGEGQWRYHTEEQARAGHDQVVRMVRLLEEGIAPDEPL